MNVYAIQSETGPIKIGVSANPGARLGQLTKMQPHGACIIHIAKVPRDKAYPIEAAAHALLKEKRLQGEWFDVTQEQAIAAIEYAINAIERGETAKQMLLRRMQDNRATCVPGDVIGRLLWSVENKQVITWRHLEWILGGKPFSVATIRRHYEASGPPPPEKRRKAEEE